MADISTVETPAPPTPSRTSRLISASAVMAAGTALSRVMGFIRLMLLVFLFGNGTRQAEMFTIANTVPNSMYILLAGGVLNTVLVPQIVRAIKTDPDGGEAYTNRIMTAGLIVLGVIAVGLTLAVPLIINLYSAQGWKASGLAPQYDSMVMLGYYCMPQVFFYGVHVLAGQVLNARDKFGPMMWAPIANNVVSILVLLVFLATFSRGNPGQPFTTGQELLLGLGSTLGIAVQAAVLVPFLKAVGYRFRPRFDFKNTGLGKTFRLAKWTLGFVLVTQIALVVVSKLATGATVGGRGAGLTAYYNAYAVFILPHSLITVSLATAMLPMASRLAAAGDLAGVAEETNRTIRLAITALLPSAVALVALGLPIAQLAFGFGQGARDASYVGWALMALAVGLVPFTVQYICLRAFYSLEDTRSTFFLQIVISGLNVLLGVAVVLALDRPSLVATGLATAYSVAYLCGVLVSFRWLRRRLPTLDATPLVQHCVRLLIAVTPAALVAWLICWGFTSWSTSRLALAASLVVAGLVAVVIFLAAARLLHIREVTEIVATVLRRGGPASATSGGGEPGRTSALHNDLDSSGGSASVSRPESLNIGEVTAASVPPPGGLNENAELMAQAATARTYLDDDTASPEAASNAPGPDTELTHEPASPAASLPAGTILASRYRLEELIAESQPTVTWRAFDQVLSRSVLVHLLAPGDPEAVDLLSAARKASVATDSRFLRVLDAVHSVDPHVGSYIVCEYATGQSLEVILSQGPLSGLEAAWVVREVADALSGVHSLGLYHRRINPDTVIITPTGNIKIVGLLIEAALRPTRGDLVHGADTPELVDVMDLGRLLYASVVARWPGGPAFSLPAAPRLGRRWMTPRQVRAGVSPALDNVCDQILGDPPRHRMPQLSTANSVVNALTKVLGSADASLDLERRLKQPIPKVGRRTERPNQISKPAPVSALLDQPTEPMHPLRPQVLPAAAVAPVRVNTRLPVPPAQVRTSSGDTTVIRKVPARPVQPRQPQRWIGLLILMTVLLLAGAIVAGLVMNKRIAATADPPASTAPTASPPASVPPVSAKIAIRDVRDFDPQADPPSENPNEVKFAWDGNTKTRWRTVEYRGTPKLGNLKRGVGLVVDLGSAQPVKSVKLALSGNSTAVELRVPKVNAAQTAAPPMNTDKSWVSVAADSKAGSLVTLTPGQSVTTRYVLVYLTSLPKEGNGYRGGIYEIEVLR